MDNGVAELVAELREAHHQLDQWKKIAEEARQAKNEAYRKGKRAGLTKHAWWKDGVQYVGTCGCTLEEALGDV